MPTPTYTLIDSVTLTSSAASVSFTSISATGKGDLILVASVQSTQESSFGVSFNNITTNIVDIVSVNGNGSGAYSAVFTGQNRFQDSYTDTPTSGFGLYTTTIFDYSATDKHKPMLMRGNRADDNVSAIAGRWASTAAITSITATAFGSTTSLKSGSSFFLYQIVSE
jgi:hypothetical protein